MRPRRSAGRHSLSSLLRNASSPGSWTRVVRDVGILDEVAIDKRIIGGGMSAKRVSDVAQRVRAIVEAVTCRASACGEPFGSERRAPGRSAWMPREVGSARMRFRELASETAKQLRMETEIVAYVVEGWFLVAGRRLTDGHTIPTPIGTIKTRRADPRVRRSRGYRRDVKIVPRTLFRVQLNRIDPDRPAVLSTARVERMKRRPGARIP